MRSSRKAVILGVIMFLITMLIYSSFYRPNVVFAYYCENFGDRTDPPSNCSPRFREGRLNPTSPPTNELPPSQPPPPKNALPPSPITQTCPDGSTPDAKGNCPTTKTNQQVAPSQSLASNNPQPEHHYHKGQDSTTKKDNDGSSQQQAPS